ncbi:MAG: undecaprenyl-phosphate galactose phosphotransferase WbaP [Leptolyngbyaceae cyanobacterium MO_188.B28]|nr:undecaprenyl-phosphate galactose phosphotransferase WbaP [Leptolyngbyaceae cyanobacterium MO_188.B28]
MVINQTLKPAISALKISARPWPSIALLISADWLALCLACFISVQTRYFFNGQFHPSFYWRLWPVLSVFILAYALSGLYPGVVISPVDELRRTSLANTLIYLVLSTTIFLFKEGELYSRGIFLMAWGLTLIFVPLGRVIIRHLFAHRRWWGYPVVVLGAGRTGEMVIRALKRQPSLGLKPVAVLDDDPDKHGSLVGVPVIGGIPMAPKLIRRLQTPYAIVAMPGVPRTKLLAILERYGKTFPHMLIIPDLFGFASLWVAARDLGGMLGLEVRQQLLLPGPRLIKACLDYCLAIVVGLVCLPIIGLIALMIRLDSPGPIFYGQTRLGRSGRYFRAWKFRSMAPNADEVLAQYLEKHPELQEAWEKDQKLRSDPRITRVGHFLRRTSLDELPQLWNVLRGEMSLVGPRPIVDDEVWRYADKFELYAKVLPGITGLWQVSGRNNISYPERVNLDAYYVRNWSVWLDIYILIRTVWVVTRGDGAY